MGYLWEGELLATMTELVMTWCFFLFIYLFMTFYLGKKKP